MKRSHQLLLLGVIMVGLLGANFFLKNKPLTKTPATPVVPAASAQPEIVLAQLDQAKINKIVLKSTKNGILTLVKQNGVWQSEPKQPFELNQSQIETIISTFAALNATELIAEQPHDLQQYGLQQPAVSVAVYSNDNTAPLTVNIGDLTPANGNYYAQRQGDPKVYAISGADGGRFTVSLQDLHDSKGLPQVNLQQCKAFKLIRPGQPTVEIAANPERDQTGADYGMNNWIMVQPYRETLTIDVDKFSKEVLPGLEGLQPLEVIADQPTGLAQYGLDRPAYEIKVQDQAGQTLHLLIGKEKDSSSFFAKTPEDPAVFTITKDILPILTLKPFELVNRLSYIINIDTVDKIEIAAGNVKEMITLSRKIKKARSKEEQDETVTTYRVGGKTVKEDIFKTFYRSLIGLSFEGQHSGKLTETNPEVKTTFYLNQGKVRVYHLNYVSYNNDFYAIFRNGQSEFLISKDQVKMMIKDLQSLVQGKLKARNI